MSKETRYRNVIHHRQYPLDVLQASYYNVHEPRHTRNVGSLYSLSESGRTFFFTTTLHHKLVRPSIVVTVDDPSHIFNIN
jgi:hypothetical protein